jgi:hypothetical protein
MAIIYSYPSATPTTADVVIGTLLSDDSGENPTKSFSIADIIGLVPAAGTGGTVTSIGLTNTDGFLTIVNSPITTAGNIAIDLYTSGGTPSGNTYYRGDGQWAVPPNATPNVYTLTGIANGPNTDLVLTDTAALTSIVKLIPTAPITITAASNQITIGSTAVTGVTSSDTYIVVDNTTATTPILSLAVGGTVGDNTNFYRGDGTWQTITAGTMSSWNITAGTGTAEQVDNTETVTIAGGTGITTAVAATNTVTVTNSGVTSIVAGTNIDITSATGDITVSTPDSVVNSNDTYTSVPNVTNIISLTQAEYDAIGAGNYNANTLYVIP